MNQIDKIKNLIISGIQSNLELISVLDTQEADKIKIDVLQTIKEYASIELANLQSNFVVTESRDEQPTFEEPIQPQLTPELPDQEELLSPEELERQVQLVLDHIQKHGSFNTLRPIPQQVLKEVNKRMDEIFDQLQVPQSSPEKENTPEPVEEPEVIEPTPMEEVLIQEQPIAKEEDIIEEPTLSPDELEKQVQTVLTHIQEHGSFNTLTPISKEVLEEVNIRLGQLKIEQEQLENVEELSLDNQPVQIEENSKEARIKAKREEQIQALVDYYIEYGKLNTLVAIPPDILDEVSKRIVEHRKRTSNQETKKHK